MLTKIFFVCVALLNCGVSANQLFQALPIQGCPICQNGQSTQPQGVPMILQPAANIQPYPKAVIAQSPMAYPVQNQGSCYECQPQPQNNQASCFPNNNRQQYITKNSNQNQYDNFFNKLLSNPALKSIFDPNNRFFNQNCCEVARNNQNNNAVPNVVNNYIIVPPEFLLEDCKCINSEGKKVTEEKHLRRNHQSKRRQKEKIVERRDNKPKAGRLPNSANRRVKEDKKCQNVTENYGERPRKAKKRQSKSPDIKVKVLNENVTQELNKIESPKEMTENIKTTTEKVDTTDFNTFLENFVTTTPISEIISGQEVNKHKNSYSDIPQEYNTAVNGKNNALDINSEAETVTPIEIKFDERKETTSIKPKRKKKHQSNTRTNNNKQQRNNREEAAIQDFRHKYPNIPEDVIRNLLNHMKKRLEQEQLATPAFYYPQFPINYDQIAQTPVINNPVSTNTQNRNTRKNNRRCKKRRKQTQRTTTKPTSVPTKEIEAANNDFEATTIPTTIKDITIKNEVTTKPVVLTEIVTETNPVEITTEMLKEDGQKSPDNPKIQTNLPDLGGEDVVPTIYMNGLVDEYYPDFTMDNQYFSNEDFSLFSLENDRYHYTTDKNYQLEELNRERRRFDMNSDNNYRPEKIIFRLKNSRRGSSTSKPISTERPNIRRPKLPKSKSNDVKETTQNPKVIINLQNHDALNEITTPRTAEIDTERPKIEEHETIFRTPPTLEIIDFETKAVNRDGYILHGLDFTNKVSSYSDVKTPQYDRELHSKKEKSKPKDEIETVYARSKVVTYGIPVEETSLEKDLSSDYDGSADTVNFDSDEKTIVFAKSISEFW